MGRKERAAKRQEKYDKAKEGQEKGLKKALPGYSPDDKKFEEGGWHTSHGKGHKRGRTHIRIHRAEEEHEEE